MTKVQVEFDLAGHLEQELLEKLAEACSIYGILRIEPAASLDALVIDYDATRLSEADLAAALRRRGIAVKRRR